MESQKLPRRGLVRIASVLGLGALVSKSALAAECRRSPAQTEGPYYPVTTREDVDFDLTRVAGVDGAAAGERIVVRGRVLNQECQPVAGALVEIWQANTHGRYDHPDDDSGIEFDPNFQYWARVTTGPGGTYSFKTVLPGLYPGRTRHIHYRVSAPNFRTLTTQLYFKGEPKNSSDGIYMSLTSAQRRLVTTDLVADANGLRTGSFEISLGASARATPVID